MSACKHIIKQKESLTKVLLVKIKQADAATGSLKLLLYTVF